MNNCLLVIIYKAFVESVLQNEIIIRSGLHNVALNLLNVTKNYLLKVIPNKHQLYPTTQLYTCQMLNGSIKKNSNQRFVQNLAPRIFNRGANR